MVTYGSPSIRVSQNRGRLTFSCKAYGDIMTNHIEYMNANIYVAKKKWPSYLKWKYPTFESTGLTHMISSS